MFQSLQSTGLAPDNIRILTSKDRLRTVAVQMTDELHARCWGRLYVAVPVDRQPTEVLTAEEAVEWVERERAVGQISTKDRLAGLRTDWLAVAGDIAGVERRAV